MAIPARAREAPVVIHDPFAVLVSFEIDCARGALLGTFVGDALGMPYEGAAGEEVPEHLEMVDARLGRGSYTDDTEMAIALAESLLDRGTVDAQALGRAFAAAFDPGRGYGSGTTEVLRLVRSGVHPHDAARSAFAGEGSLGNGAAMRVAPVAVFTPVTPPRWRMPRGLAPASPTLTRSRSTPRSSRLLRLPRR